MMLFTFFIELHVADLARNQCLCGQEVVLEGLDDAGLFAETVTGVASHFFKQIYG
jgi:hypothetical protein